MPVFGTILIANRGEIAVRIARTCRDLGIRTVAVHSDPDAGARHVQAADEAVLLPGTAAAETYLRIDLIVEAARRTGAEAIHPGYGFLSERAGAARAVIDAGLTWIGPSPDAVEAVGDKVRARRLADAAGVPVVPGTLEPVTTADDVHAFGDRNGYPVAIKAAGGGGGRGFRVANAPGDVEAALEGAAREATLYFGSGDVYLERYVARPKHIEIQVLAERPGQAIWLGARECSLQRRHQKLVEETPPSRYLELAPTLGDAAVRVTNACGYTNAGTVEFLVDQDVPGAESADGGWYFLEVNARLQVEHTITEELTGLDLVACQLRIAAGEPLGLSQDELLVGGRFAPRGHAIECRINAEDPARRFLPSPGIIATYREPAGPGVRVDGGFGSGDEISPAYDSLIAKLVVRGTDREHARRRMLRALDEFEIDGVRTTIPAHRVLLRQPAFVDGTYSTRTVEEGALDELAAAASSSPAATETSDPDLADGAPVAAPSLIVDGKPVSLWNPAMAASVPAARRATASGSTYGTAEGGGPASTPTSTSTPTHVATLDGSVAAPMHGTIVSVLVEAGQAVQAGERIAVLEAMKMETAIVAPSAGTVADLTAQPGMVVESGQVLAVIR